jgi:hypothetical protein
VQAVQDPNHLKTWKRTHFVSLWSIWPDILDIMVLTRYDIHFWTI